MQDSTDLQNFTRTLISLRPKKSKPKASGNAKSSKSSSARFGLLLEDDEPIASSSSSSSKKKKEKSSKSKDRSEKVVKPERSIRQRGGADAWESDEEEKEAKRRRLSADAHDAQEAHAYQRPGTPPPETEAERLAREEREIEEDMRERDELDARLRAKDRATTKTVVLDRGGTAADGELALRDLMAENQDVRAAKMEEVRLRSRQEYLSKREAQRRDLLKAEILDEQILFKNQTMSRREKQEFDRKVQLLEILEQRSKIDDGRDGYMMPDDYLTEQGKLNSKKQKDALFKRYDENKPIDGEFSTDVDQWELAQTQASNFRTGALDKEPPPEVEYEYVFDESQQIAFEQVGALEGAMSADDALLLAQVAELEKKSTSKFITIFRCLLTYQQ